MYLGKEAMNANKVPVFTMPVMKTFLETNGPHKKALFIPDINKWEKWDGDIINEIKKVDYAFLDATFYDGNEINNRNISEIPHPFVIESISKFNNLEPSEKNKILFIHFNHTNALLNVNSNETKEVIKMDLE